MVTVITSDNFENEVRKADLPVIMDCYADWCGPCKAMAPMFDELSEKYDGKVKFCKINIDDNMDVVKPYRVMSIPNFLAFKDGEKVAGMVGAQDLNGFTSFIEGLL